MYLRETGASLAAHPQSYARLGVVSADRVALGLVVEVQHAEHIRSHQHEHEHGNDVDQHGLVIPLSACFDASPSAGMGGTISRRRRRPWG